MWLSKIFQIVGVRFSSAGAVGCDEEEAWAASYPKEVYHGDEDSGTDSDYDYRDYLDDADFELYEKLRGAEFDYADELFKPGRAPVSIGNECDAIDKLPASDTH